MVGCMIKLKSFSPWGITEKISKKRCKNPNGKALISPPAHAPSDEQQIPWRSRGFAANVPGDTEG